MAQHMPPPGYQKPQVPQVSQGPPMVQGYQNLNLQNQQISSLEDTMKMLAQNTLQFQQSTTQNLNANTQSIAKLEYTVSQLARSIAQRDKGSFPSQPEANPKGQTSTGQFVVHDDKGKVHEQVNAVTTRRMAAREDDTP